MAKETSTAGCHSPAPRADHLARTQVSDQPSKARDLLTHSPMNKPARHPAHLLGSTQARPPTCSRTRTRTPCPAGILTYERTGNFTWEPTRHRMRKPVNISTRRPTREDASNSVTLPTRLPMDTLTRRHTPSPASLAIYPWTVLQAPTLTCGQSSMPVSPPAL
ncbi:hypothetical protein GCM10010095_62940 [Streptomyces anthocyanicus]|nr:hypothetical protein GCM10010095_62940 [Streptomyces anthocyanicus]